MLHFDDRPVAFILVGYVWLGIVGFLAVRKSRADFWGNPWLFLLLALGWFGFMRLPTVLFNQELNVDESQLLAQALTLKQDPVFWRSVDGTTGGPLDSYALIVPTWLGLPFDYTTARLVAFALLGLNLVFLFLTARRWFGPTPARLALLPPVVLLALTQHGDLLHYSSELVAVMLLGVVYWLYSVSLAQTTPRAGTIFLAGLLAGMVPFGKLQGVPLAACGCFFIAAGLVTRPGFSGSQKARWMGWLVAGGLAFPFLVIALTAWKGVLGDFVAFYLVANFQYAGNFDLWKNTGRLPSFFRKGGNEFQWLIGLLPLLGLLLGAVWLWRGFRPRSPWQVAVFLVVLLASGLYAVMRTGSEYVHYLLFLMTPVGLLLAFCWHELEQAFRSNQAVTWLAGLVSLIAVFPYGFRHFNQYRQGAALNPYPTPVARQVPRSEVTKLILTRARPGEKLAVWGWMCKYYVEAQMPQAVNENHTIRCVYPNPMRHRYQERYVADLARSLPPVFVDAVGPNSLWLNDRATQAHESIAPLKALVAHRYTLLGEVEHTRVYVRNDRYALRASR